MAETNLRGWADLPDDCLFNILNRLTSKEERWQVSMFVCKSWLRTLFLSNPSLHTVFDLEWFFEAHATSPAQWFTPSESPNWWTREFESNIDNVLHSVVVWSDGGLTQIRVRHCSDYSLSLVAQRCPNLEVLSIKSSPNVTNESIVKIASGCPKLKEVDISYCYGVSHKSLEMLGKNCTNIFVLKLNNIGLCTSRFDPSPHLEIVPTKYLNSRPKDGGFGAAAIGQFMPQLLHLELRFSTISKLCLPLITKRCKKLEYLALSGCKNLTRKQIDRCKFSMNNLKNLENRSYIPRIPLCPEPLYIGGKRKYTEAFLSANSSSSSSSQRLDGGSRQKHIVQKKSYF